jgi:outer membrane protein OmpA-like peptidoglycan-associated protein
MRGRFALVLAAAAAMAACGALEKKDDAGGPASGGSSVQGTGRLTSGGAAPSNGGGASARGAAVGGVMAWADPEPPGAQATAEQVVSAPWNEDKTTHLTMSITTLVDSKTGLVGLQTAVTPAQTTLDERLTRLGAEVTGAEVTIRLPGSVLFDFDSAQVRPDAERTLAEVAEVIKGYAKRPVRVEGHTDSIASDDYNQKLSERRAAAVRIWLAGTGVESARLTTRGWGKSKPVGDNATAEGRQRNRRVEVIIEKGP